MKAWEVNFDGLVGPTHNYAGLSYGNVASKAHQAAPSNPKAAARQGLDKMKALADQGIKQAVLLPHERPAISPLRELGYQGSDAEILARVAREEPALLSALSSASPMWTANAATVTPSADSRDGRVHFTPANLNAKFHRAIEHDTTARMLRRIFASERHFNHHPVLPNCAAFGDEGAANHTRFCASYEQPGVAFFVYGQQAFNDAAPKPQRFPARQTLEASQAIARQHGLSAANTVFAQQRPDTIDAGVFHNDVIAVGNGNVLLYHECAFVDTEQVLQALNDKLTGTTLTAICVPNDRVSVNDAVQSYLFNSQLLSRADSTMTLVVPAECRALKSVSDYLDALVAMPDNPITEIQVFDLKQSMNNGGGPACLRLRVVLNEAECRAMAQGVWLTDQLYQQLGDWIERHYRDRLVQVDLADPALLNEVRTALDELTQLTGLGNIYPFQQ